MFYNTALLLLGAAAATTATAQSLNFTEANGQIFTPGLVIVDSPQPGTPLGGDTVQVALDVSGDGKLPVPTASDSDSGDATVLHNVTMFLYSYTTGRNLTITNGTASAGNASLGDILAQEPGSTVKHVNWVWPDCLVGDGQPGPGSDRGVYNISIRQYFRLNGTDHYTVFDLPISVTNSIPADHNGGARPSCDSLDNQPLLTPEQVDVAGANAGVPIMFGPGGDDVVQVSAGSGSGSGSGSGGTSGSAGALSMQSGGGMLGCVVAGLLFSALI